MRELILFLALFLLSSNSNLLMAQELSNDTVDIQKTYVGVLSTTSFNTDSFYVSQSASFRAGGQVRYQILPWIAVKGWTIFDMDQSGAGFTVGEFATEFQAGKKVQVTVGQTPSVTTLLHRPLGVTAFGQFEPAPLATLPGISPGIRMELRENPESQSWCLMGAGWRNNNLELQGGVQGFLSPNVKIASSLWLNNRNSIGIALTIEGERFRGTWSTGSSKETEGIFSCFLSYNPTPSIGVYNSIIGINKAGWRISTGEAGIFKLFSGNKGLEGLIGVAYNYTGKTINCYLMLNSR